MSRRQAILETLLIFAVFCLEGAWPVPEVNEPYYLGKAIHFWNPQWASRDFFLQTPDTHVVFYLTVGWLSRFLAPVALAWTLRLITWAMLAWSWQRLSAAVVPRKWASLLTGTLFVFLLQHYNMAGEWVVGGAEAKGFSYALVFLALEAMVEGYWNRMWLLLGIATALHALVGGWAAVAMGVVWLAARLKSSPLSTTYDPQAGTPGAPERVRVRAVQSGIDDRQILSSNKPSPPAPLPVGEGRLSSPPATSAAGKGRFWQPSAWIGLLAAFVLALPGLVPSLLLNRGVKADVAAEAAKIYVFKRFPHHLDPVKMWNDGFVLPFIFVTLIWLLLWKTASDSPAARRLRAFTVAALALAAIGAVVGVLGHYHHGPAGWMRFYWFRLADVAVPLALSLTAVRWFLARKMRVATWLVIAVAAFHAVDCVVLRFFSEPPFLDRPVDGAAWRAACYWSMGQPLRPLFPRQPRAEKLRDGAEWLDVCRWIADPQHTPPDARFLIPKNACTFKWYTARGEVANWKESPQDAASLLEWWQRIHDIYVTGSPPPLDYYTSLADAGPKKLQRFADKYDADYLVTQVGASLLPLPVIYKNDAFVVYKMKP